MDFGGEAEFLGGNVSPMVQESPSGGGFDNWGSGLNNQAIWATEDDCKDWSGRANSEISLNSIYDLRLSQSWSGAEPTSKKTRNSRAGGDSQRIGHDGSKAIGKMFFKTKLCCKFRAGVCPYITNCNFSHANEELHRPPPNCQETVAPHEDERGVVLELPREEHQIPTFSSTNLRGESQRSYKGRHCKKFYTEEGCPYGDNCTFLHDEQSRVRESVAISLSPSVGGAYGNNANGQDLKPSNWKTRICNKWETTGSCPFGRKCHFAHGLQELHKYGGRRVDVEGNDSSPVAPESKQSRTSLKAAETLAASIPLAPHSDIHHLGLGVPSQRPSVLSQKSAQRPFQKWKGPDKMSNIYGDWIDDIE